MNKFYIVLFSVFYLFTSCASQIQTPKVELKENVALNAEWKEYFFDDAGIKISFPCEPQKEISIIQDKPKLVRDLGVKCDDKEVTFAVEVNEHFGALDESQMQPKLDTVENALKEIVGQKNNFESKDLIYKNKFPMRILDITNPTTYWRQANIINKRAVYKVLVFYRKQEDQSLTDFNNDFEIKYKKFFDSFQITEK